MSGVDALARGPGGGGHPIGVSGEGDLETRGKDAFASE